MNTLTLELIAYNHPDYGDGDSISLPIVNHVHKRIERFIYQNSVKEQSVPIAYIENEPLNARTNLQIVDRTWSIPANSLKQSETNAAITIVNSNAYSSAYKDILATNKTFIDSNGRTRPLFFRHVLPDNTVQCELQIRTRGNKLLVDSGYLLDLDGSSIYTNYLNWYNLETDSYRLYYVISTDSDGNSQETLLNPIPVAKEADWNDIDLTTGKLKSSYPVFSKEKSGSGYSFYFSFADQWYIKPLEKALITAKESAGVDADEPWFMRFGNGDVSTNVNNAVRRYYVPEFNKQSFIPSKPIRFSPYEKLIKINDQVLATTRRNLKIAPTEGLHLTLYIYDSDGVLIKVLSTDPSLDNVRYNDTSVFYDTGSIDSWDNASGLISLGIELHSSWSFNAKYFYYADDYEYTALNFNPLLNPDVFDFTYVFYIIPDTNVEDKAIHHLKIDSGGVIVEASQSLGLTYPNLQLLNADNTYNENTIIGTKYLSEIDTNTFIHRFSAGYPNDYGYGILSEISVIDIALEDNQLDIDVRRKGDAISPNKFKEAIARNPRILQSYLGYGEDGQEVPRNGVMIIRPPITLLEDYGGVFTEEEAENLLRMHHPSYNAAIIEWDYPAVDLSGWSNSVANNLLTWTWEGPDYDYRLYRKQGVSNKWELVTTLSSPAEGTLTYNDTDVQTNEVWYYSVRIFDGSVEYPASNSLAIRVS